MPKLGINFIACLVDKISNCFKPRYENLETQVEPGTDNNKKKGGEKQINKEVHISEPSKDSSSEDKSERAEEKTVSNIAGVAILLYSTLFSRIEIEKRPMKAGKTCTKHDINTLFKKKMKKALRAVTKMNTQKNYINLKQ